jgi:predicted small lipoprotein YifL
MRNITTLLTILLSVLIIGSCGKKAVKYCPTPQKPVLLEIQTDKDLLEALNQAVNYCHGLESTVRCYEAQ